MQDLSKLNIKGIKDPWKAGQESGWDVIDGRTVSADRTLEADVAIIGTGAGGGVSAEILAKRGLKVLLIEAGKLMTARISPSTKARPTGTCIKKVPCVPPRTLV